MNEFVVGEILLFAGSYAMNGWLVCDGQAYGVTDYPDLFDLIGFSYGGNGVNTFAVPDLRGQSPLGSQLFGQYLICFSGVSLASSLGTMGELRLLAYPAPSDSARNWLACAGQLLPLNANQALFSILGTTYGGNGQSTFMLPNLTGRSPLAQGGYVICTNGIYPNLNQPTSQPRDYIGAVRIFCGTTGEGRVLTNTLLCNGQFAGILQNTAFFSVIGTSYGGDGQRTFQMPNLVGKSPAEIQVSSALVFGAYLICQSGFFPVRP